MLAYASGMNQPNGQSTVSAVLPDGTIVELVYDPSAARTHLAVARVGVVPALVPHLDLPNGERLVPYAPSNNLIATGCVLLPSAIGPLPDKDELLIEVRAYLRRYVDLSPLFETICAHYALLTWVYDAFRELPYLRFRGDYGTGKTRALMALGSICYKPFFASGASTVSPIFHVLDAFRGTLVLDEADFRFTDATAALTKILNNGNVDGLPVLRTMTNRNKEFDPRAFRVFGPKLIGMRERFADDALESRFLTEETGLRPLRASIPIQLPASLSEDALILRNKLLAWRFAARGTVGVLPDRAAPGVEPRFNQTALALLSLIDDPAIRSQVHDALAVEQEQIVQDRSASPEAAVVSVLDELFSINPDQALPVSLIAERATTSSSLRIGRTVTPKWLGWFLRAKLRLATTRTRGVYVLQPTERLKVQALAARFGVGGPSQAQGRDVSKIRPSDA